MNLFNENELVKSLENFIDEVCNKRSIVNVDKIAIAQMIIEEISKRATQLHNQSRNNEIQIGMDDATMEKAIIKATTLVDEWKKSKEKKEKKEIVKPVSSKKSKDSKPKVARPVSESKEIKVETKPTGNIEFTLFDF